MSKIQIKRFTSRMLGANTYIIYNDGEGVIIDPCTKVGIVSNFCKNSRIKVKNIILTHCHIDHTLYLNEYLEEFGVGFAIHKDGNALNMDPELNGARLFGMRKSFREADTQLSDGDEIYVGTLTIRIIATPGHSPGSICIYGDNMLICGDTLFNMSIGRSDLFGGNQGLLTESLAKLMLLPDDTIIYPGHGTFSTIKFERENNPFLLE